MSHTVDEVRRALAPHHSTLLSLPNVVATGIGYKVVGGERTDRLSIICSVTHKVAEEHLPDGGVVPSTCEGVPTDVRVTGVIVPLQSRTDRVRPAPGGVSVGHVNITAGTLGCLVEREGELHILSNNHVLANSNDAAPGDSVLQPGPHDGGRHPADHIADLADFVPIHFEDAAVPCPVGSFAAAALNAPAAAIGRRTRLRAVRIAQTENRVDAAIARPLRVEDVEDRILEIGTVAGTAGVELGTPIRKSGRTTGHTTGAIEQVDVTVRVDYGAGRSALFVDQLMAGAMSEGGDSGSAVLDMERHLIGLLFAGSQTSTIINRIQHVFAELGISLPSAVRAEDPT